MPRQLGQGVVEVETLRRYGRVPIGTRAHGSFVLTRWDSTTYWVDYTLRIGDDPREIGANCLINVFHGGSKEIVRLSRYVRGVLTRFEGNLADYAISRVVDSLEEMNTPSGYQRFRVVRAEWSGGQEAVRGRPAAGCRRARSG
jgi:hypothetical protein